MSQHQSPVSYVLSQFDSAAIKPQSKAPTLSSRKAGKTSLTAKSIARPPKTKWPSSAPSLSSGKTDRTRLITNDNESHSLGAVDAPFVTPGIRFLDLPAEIRNTIYSLALQHPRKIFIGKHGRTIKKEHLLKLDYPYKNCGWSGVSYRVKIYKQISVRVLLANKQINAEATPMLYGGNVFTFGDYGRFNIWSKQIGPSFAQLRVIEIYGDNLSRMVMPKFSIRAEGLRTLKLSIDALELGNHKGTAEMLSMFLDTGFKKVMQEGEKKEVHACEVIVVESPTSKMLRKLYQSKTHSGGYPEIQEVAKFGNKVRRELGRLLWTMK